MHSLDFGSKLGTRPVENLACSRWKPHSLAWHLSTVGIQQTPPTPLSVCLTHLPRFPGHCPWACCIPHTHCPSRPLCPCTCSSPFSSFKSRLQSHLPCDALPTPPSSGLGLFCAAIMFGTRLCYGIAPACEVSLTLLTPSLD